MKSAIFETYGDASVLKIIEKDEPNLGANEVLVSVRAASVNPIDWKVRSGQMKFIPGQKFPHGVGSDFAGVVASVGSEVSKWKVGDEVIGWTNSFVGGACATHVAVSERQLVAKPSKISFQEASAVPTGGVAALQGLRDVGKLESGQKVLINGATGGVGSFAVPLAKSMGGIVTAFAGKSGWDMASKLGADHLYDYTEVNALTLETQFDVIFELSGKLTFDDAKASILCSHGIFVDPIPNPQAIVGSLFYNLFHGQHHGILMSKLNAKDVSFVAEKAAAGEIGITVGAEFPLDEISKAHELGESGKVVGKIVIVP